MKPELLSPAGDIEKLKFAFEYGADAVYMGGKILGMRAKSKNFDISEMEEGIEYAKSKGKRVYVTVNILAHNADFDGMEAYFLSLRQIGADALIVSDPGVFMLAKKTVPKMEIHISTQANCTNIHAARFWHDLGASRVILARELSLKEIAEIQVPGLQKEAFVHGAMCMAYSGRCLISNYLSFRDANRGECSQPCRWNYSVVEEKSGEKLDVFESENGAFIFSSKDLCMINHIGEMIDAGVRSFKIEGRMKTEYYVAVATKIYREAIDDYCASPEKYKSKLGYYNRELVRVSMREYTTGFYFGKVEGKDHAYSLDANYRTQDFLGVVLDYDVSTGLATIEQRNKFSCGETVEIISSANETFSQKITLLLNSNGEKAVSAPHPKEILKLKMDFPVKKLDIIRKGGLYENL